MVFLKRDGRHGDWAHPFFTMVGMFTVIVGSTLFVHDVIVARSGASYHPVSMLEYQAPPLNFHDGIAWFFLAYLGFMIVARYLDCGSYIFYEAAWCCNSSLIMASWGILTNRPLLVGASIAGVCCDQLMWWVDCGLFVFTRTFPVGVAKYLLWPQTSWSKRWLCTHHLWFIPLALWTLGWHLPVHSFLLSCWFTSVSTGISRYTTPKFFTDRFNKHEHYMNVNAGHEFWRDVKIPILHVFNKSHAVVYLTFMFVCINTGLNGPPYLLLDYCMDWLHAK